MSVGTRSVLFGAHQFLLHPLMVALAWWRLYGFPWDPRLWVAFVVHDLGYIGKPNMDGPEGEKHVELGARVMYVFGWKWSHFALTHSRFYARWLGTAPSRLCFADKLAFALTPAWLYVPMVRLTGEILEYRSEQSRNNTGTRNWHNPRDGSDWEWQRQCAVWCRKYAFAHAGGEADTWTPSA